MDIFFHFIQLFDTFMFVLQGSMPFMLKYLHRSVIGRNIKFFSLYLYALMVHTFKG